MIIDCHSHIWPSTDCLGQAERFSCISGPKATEKEFFEHLEATEPADITFVLGFVSDLLGSEIPNNYIKEYMATAPDKLIGFAGIDPHRPESVENVQKYREEGFSGLVLSPACQGFHPCHTRAMEIYSLASEFGMPVYLLYGDTLPSSAIMENAEPRALDEVARNFPDLKIIISHLGFPWIEQTVALLAKHKNIFADIAGLTDKPWQAYRSLNIAYEYDVIDKLLLGSDYPKFTIAEAIESLYNLNKLTLDMSLPAVPRENLKNIVERDAMTLLGLNEVNEKE
ncbi:MAG: amidohydrolase family protein [Phycisphaerae bacterium]|nr:amidohydrolase family protein [Phycisphaerae bacterium]